MTSRLPEKFSNSTVVVHGSEHSPNRGRAMLHMTSCLLAGATLFIAFVANVKESPQSVSYPTSALSSANYAFPGISEYPTVRVTLDGGESKTGYAVIPANKTAKNDFEIGNTIDGTGFIFSFEKGVMKTYKLESGELPYDKVLYQHARKGGSGIVPFAPAYIEYTRDDTTVHRILRTVGQDGELHFQQSVNVQATAEPISLTEESEVPYQQP